MEQEKKNDLSFAYHTLCQYMIWRKGHTDEKCESADIAKALSIAAGAILDYISCDFRMETAEKALKSAENSFVQKDWLLLVKKQELEKCRKENRRLKAILAGHKIKYRKGNGK